MRDRHARPLVSPEELLEPRDALGVQMVGRLVEEEQVRLAEEQLAERHAPPLPTRQVVHHGFRGRAAESVERPINCPLQLPPVLGLDAILDALHLLGELLLGSIIQRGVRHLEGDFVEGVEEVARLLDCLFDVLQHCRVLGELGLLLEVADVGPPRGRRVTVVPVVDARHNLHEGGLAGSVVAQDPDLCPWVEGEVDVVEELLAVVERLPKLVHLVDVFALVRVDHLRRLPPVPITTLLLALPPTVLRLLAARALRSRQLHAQTQRRARRAGQPPTRA
mmetsp:Transcript_66491/g.157598  ORF Transcript_66491/g.157598 Transcript_66491/m.157598 type:complete len:278 (-) Transcript_66491:164-997(-)